MLNKTSISYTETLDFLYSQLPMYQRQGRPAFKKDLTNIIKLSDFLGNPHKDLKAIHIAGTNGKGSVSHILSAVFTQHGLKTGLYTSPHYKDFRERIKIDGIMMSKQDVVAFVDHIQPALNEISPSFFEMSVAMAFWYFRKMECDIVVLETGLGGRLDSTNIIDPLISVITNIGWDHQNMLGDSLLKIAGEKAGIIKANTPVIIGEKQDELKEVFEEKATTTNSKLYYSEDLIKISEGSNEMQFYANEFFNDTIQVDIAGPFTQSNLQTSLAVVKLMNSSFPGFSLTPDITLSALNRIKELSHYIGRWHHLSMSGDPIQIIADSAHNIEGMSLVFSRITESEYKFLHIVIGFVKEKNLEEILPVLPKKARYYYAAAKIPRAMSSKDIKITFDLAGYKGRSYVSVRNAFKAAKRRAKPGDLILVTGSIFVVAEVL